MPTESSSCGGRPRRYELSPAKPRRGTAAKIERRRKKAMRTGCHAGGVPVLPIFAFFCGSCGKNGLRPVGVQGGDLIWGSGGRAFRSPFVSAVHLPLAALRLRGFFLLAFCGQTTKAKPRRGTAAKIERRRKRGCGWGSTRAGCRCSRSLRSSAVLAARTVCVPLGRKAGTCSGDLGECFLLSIPFCSPSPLGGFDASRLLPSGLLRTDNESEAAKGNSRKNRKKAQKGKRVWCHAGGVVVLPIFAFFCGSCGKNGLRPFGAWALFGTSNRRASLGCLVGAQGVDLPPRLTNRVVQKSIIMNLNRDQRKQLFPTFLTG